MNELPKGYAFVTPERFCEIVNELVDFVDEHGNPAKLTPELAERVMKCPEFLSQLRPLPPNSIIGGLDQ